MAATDYKTISELIYFGRIEHYGHMKHVADHAIEKYGRDPILVFFRAFANLLEINLQEAIRDLESVKSDEAVELCSLMALIVAYKEQAHVDREAVAALDEKLKERRKTAGNEALKYAAWFLAISSRPDKALQYADRIIKLDSQSYDGYVLRAWLYLLESQLRVDKAEELRKRAQRDLETAQELPHESSNELELVLARSKYLELSGDYQKATQVLLTLRQPNFVPKLNELMRLELAMGKWESVYQSATEMMSETRDAELFALNYSILYKIVYEGSYTEASNELRQFFDTLQQKEAQNVNLYKFYCRLFSTLCGRNMLILRQTNATMHSIVTSFEKNSSNLLEYGNQMLMAAQTSEDVDAASKVFVKALELDPDNSRAMLGFNHCKVLLGKTREFDKIYRDLELLKETMIATATTSDDQGLVAETMFIQALILQHKNKFDDVAMLLRKAFESHQQSFAKVSVSCEYLCALNIDLRMQIVKCLTKNFPPEPVMPGRQPPMAMTFAKNVLDTISSVVPGLTEAKFYQAKIKYLMGDSDTACNILQDCIDRTKEADMSEADMLLASILVEMSQVSRAEQCLSTALSLNFSIRSTPAYHLVKAKIQAKSNQMTECRKTLEAAINLPGVRKTTSRQGSAGGNAVGLKESTNLVADSDRLSIFLELSEALRAENNIHEATKIMQDAINEFRGTSEESRVMIANANLDLSRGDIESALANLTKIESDKPYYIKAREKMAEIYLEHRKDKRLYARCYKDLVDKQPNWRTKMLLADAYRKILEFEKAVPVYKSAYEENRSDAQMTKKVADAFVKMHFYGEAIDYYKSAYKKDSSMKHDLVRLLIRLRYYDEAQKILDSSEPQEQTYDLTRLIDNTRCLMARAEICNRKKQLEQYEVNLKKAQVQQREVLRRVKTEQPELNAEQIELAIEIVNKLAELAIDKGNLDEAIELYERAAKFKEKTGDVNLRMKIIKLYLQAGNLDECETQCVNVIKQDLDNREAMKIMAELMLTKNNLEEAYKYYTKLLQQVPNDFQSMLQAIRCYRFMGDLDSVPKLFESATKFASNSELEPGYIYCTGYYELFLGNVNVALKEFNKCRKDKYWGTRALKSMIEICLNPHNSVMGTIDDLSEESDEEIASLDETDSNALRTAAKLLAELKATKDTSSDYAILDAYLSLATKHTSNINEAMSKFNNLVSVKPVPAYLGIATGYLLKKDKEAARNVLKKIVRDSTWNIEEAEEFEKAYLLYTDRALSASKYDIANETLAMCLKYNKSCFRAYEYQGLMFEKESR